MSKIPDEVVNAMNGPAQPYAGNAWIDEAKAQQPGGNVPNAAAAPSSQGDAPAKGEGDESTHEIFTVSFGDFVRDMKPLEWLIYGYIQKNALEMCFGSSGAGKSFVALDMALHIAVKKAIEDSAQPETLSPKLDDVTKWHGQTTHGGRVLYVAGEGVTGLKKRALGWVQYYGFNPDTLNDYFRFSPRALPLDDDGESPVMGEWQKLLRELDVLRTRCNFVPDLIIFDTLAQNMRGEENSAKESSIVIHRAQELVSGIHNEDQHGATVLFIHHTGWGQDAQRRGRGSSAWRGAMDIEINVSHGVVSEPPAGNEKPIQKHFAVLDMPKCKDDEPQPRRFLERDMISILDENGFPIPSAEEGKVETTLILKTVTDSEDTANKIKLDSEEDKPKSSKGNDKKNDKKDSKDTPPAKEDEDDETLTPDEMALPGMEAAGSGVMSFSQLKRKGD